MWKIVVAVIIAWAILKVLKVVSVTALEVIDYKTQKKHLVGIDKNESSLREAFRLECSKEMIKADPYAKELDKVIRKIDRKNRKSARRSKKLDKYLARLK